MDFTEDLAHMGGGIEERSDAGERLYYSYTVESGERWCLESKVLNKVGEAGPQHPDAALLLCGALAATSVKDVYQ